MDYVFIVFGHYHENGKDLFDVLLVTNSDDKRREYIKAFNHEKEGYYKVTYGTFDIE